MNKQEARARDIASGAKAAKKARFVTIAGSDIHVNEALLQRARDLVGLKGYLANIPARLMPPGEVIGAYHDLWHVEQSFRMSKSDLAARPIHHHTREAIEAHLTIVFTALTIARDLQNQTGVSLKKIIQALRPLREVTIAIGGHQLTATPELTPHADAILQNLPGY